MKAKIGFCAIAALLLASSAPAGAQSLNLGGLLGGGGAGASSTTSGTSIGVPGVAEVSVGSDQSGTDVDGSVLGGGGSALNVDLSGITGNATTASVILPGENGSSGDAVETATNGVGGTASGVTGEGGTLDDLLGSGILGDGLGGLAGAGGAGGPGGAGAGPAGGFGGAVRGSGGAGGAITLASLATRPSLKGCVSAAGRSVLSFAARQDYSSREIARWNSASDVRLVPVAICSSAHATVARAVSRSPNIVRLQGAAMADPLISASLGNSRFDARDVLAVQKRGRVLEVYVF